MEAKHKETQKRKHHTENAHNSWGTRSTHSTPQHTTSRKHIENETRTNKKLTNEPGIWILRSKASRRNTRRPEQETLGYESREKKNKHPHTMHTMIPAPERSRPHRPISPLKKMPQTNRLRRRQPKSHKNPDVKACATRHTQEKFMLKNLPILLCASLTHYSPPH